jgi:hypothetical protein
VSHGLDRTGVGVEGVHLISCIEKVDEIPARTAPRVQYPHPWNDAASMDLIEQIDVDLAKLLT